MIERITEIPAQCSDCPVACEIQQNIEQAEYEHDAEIKRAATFLDDKTALSEAIESRQTISDILTRISGLPEDLLNQVVAYQKDDNEAVRELRLTTDQNIELMDQEIDDAYQDLDSLLQLCQIGQIALTGEHAGRIYKATLCGAQVQQHEDTRLGVNPAAEEHAEVHYTVDKPSTS